MNDEIKITLVSAARLLAQRVNCKNESQWARWLRHCRAASLYQRQASYTVPSKLIGAYVYFTLGALNVVIDRESTRLLPQPALNNIPHDIHK